MKKKGAEEEKSYTKTGKLLIGIEQTLTQVMLYFVKCSFDSLDLQWHYFLCTD